MKFFKVKLGTKVVKTCWKQGGFTVSLDTCVPNDWNMNKMPPDVYEKTKLVVQETRKENGRIPPITVRPHPTKKRLLQIVDGYHRWKMYGELGFDTIEVDVGYYSDKRAMMMTAELNYDRGEPDMEKYPQFMARMMKEFDDVDAKYLSERLPDSEDEIKSYMESIDFQVEEVSIGTGDDDGDDDSPSTKDVSQTDMLVEMKFAVRQPAAEVIERELSRLQKALGGGKNPRGRALEMMAVQSSQTPSGSLDASLEDDDEDDNVSLRKLSNKTIKKKLKKKAKAE
jgi:hypothetical protein